ncbi:hypothetical protein QBC34DRAFT_380866 [Podospora aff. communis PSN243]|uniref:Uncharacterized protein n=1 Tax=Podospora aff. communis PSN243 TaxID=3040156 RepID=A0AAV9GNQ1_9PEZI|nr:hypothetical protein QBC34DRAFT_380866 [Podospora aff. communis PSN243]
MEIFHHYALIFEFALVRPLIAVILALLMWYGPTVQTWSHSHTYNKDSSALMLLFYLLTDARLVPLWAASLAYLSFPHEMKIALRNAKIAGLYFLGHFLAAMFMPDMRWVLFWGVVASGWAFPLGERYYYLKGSVRGYGWYI